MESKVQAKIIKDLESRGWLVVKAINLSKNGFPDVMAFRNGKTIFVEVKAEGKKPSELQKYRIKQLTDAGFSAFVSDSFELYKEQYNSILP